MGRWTLSGALSITACLLASGARAPRRAAVAPSTMPVAPAWRVNLRPLMGGEPLGVVEGGEVGAKPETSLWFLDDGTVLVTFVTRNPGAKARLAKPGEDAPSAPLLLHVITLSANTGATKAAAARPTGSRWARVVAVRGGGFLAQAGRRLYLCTGRLDCLRSLTLPRRGDLGAEYYWAPSPSPTGRSILFLPSNWSTALVPWVWVDTQKLSVARVWRGPLSGPVGVSDSRIVMTRCGYALDDKTCLPAVVEGDLGGELHTVAPASREHNLPTPQFVTNDVLLLWGDPILILRADGQVVFREHPKDDPRVFGGCWWGAAAVAASGRRFAWPVCKLVGRSNFFDATGTEVLKRVVLFDAPFRGPSYVLSVRGPKIRNGAYMAMSPDGTKLAILNSDDTKHEPLELINLPPLRDQPQAPAMPRR